MRCLCFVFKILRICYFNFKYKKMVKGCFTKPLVLPLFEFSKHCRAQIKKRWKTFSKENISTFSQMIRIDFSLYFNNLSDNSIILFPYLSRSFFRIVLFTNSPAPIIKRPKNPTKIPKAY